MSESTPSDDDTAIDFTVAEYMADTATIMALADEPQKEQMAAFLASSKQSEMPLLELARAFVTKHIVRLAYGTPLDPTLIDEAAVSMLYHAFEHHDGAVEYRASASDLNTLEFAAVGSIALSYILMDPDEFVPDSISSWDFLIHSNGEWTVTDDPGEVFGESNGVSFILLDLCRLSAELLKLVGEPLAVVTAAEGTPEKFESRLSSAQRIEGYDKLFHPSKSGGGTKH